MSGPYALDKDYSPDDSLYHDEQSGLGVPGGAGLIKGPWAPAEDILLSSLVAKLGAKAWSAVASHMALHGHYRLGKQCRERWFNHLSPDVRKDTWTSEEDQTIINAHKAMGNKWTAISQMLVGRPANAIKNHWNSTLKRKVNPNGSSSASGAQLRRKRGMTEMLDASDQGDDEYDLPHYRSAANHPQVRAALASGSSLLPAHLISPRISSDDSTGHGSPLSASSSTNSLSTFPLHSPQASPFSAVNPSHPSVSPSTKSRTDRTKRPKIKESFKDDDDDYSPYYGDFVPGHPQQHRHHQHHHQENHVQHSTHRIQATSSSQDSSKPTLDPASFHMKSSHDPSSDMRRSEGPVATNSSVESGTLSRSGGKGESGGLAAPTLILSRTTAASSSSRASSSKRAEDSSTSFSSTALQASSVGPAGVMHVPNTNGGGAVTTAGAFSPFFFAPPGQFPSTHHAFATPEDLHSLPMGDLYGGPPMHGLHWPPHATDPRMLGLAAAAAADPSSQTSFGGFHHAPAPFYSHNVGLANSFQHPPKPFSPSVPQQSFSYPYVPHIPMSYGWPTPQQQQQQQQQQQSSTDAGGVPHHHHPGGAGGPPALMMPGTVGNAPQPPPQHSQPPSTSTASTTTATTTSSSSPSADVTANPAGSVTHHTPSDPPHANYNNVSVHIAGHTQPYDGLY